MLLFEHPGNQNTAQALQIALQCAMRQHTDLLVASTTGATALALEEMAGHRQFHGNLICVTHANGWVEKGVSEISAQTVQTLTAKQVTVLTATHALSGAERSLSTVFRGIYPAEIMAATLRMFGQGVKVCVEIAAMAADSGKLAYGQPVVCVAGSARGADTVCLLTPAHTAAILETKIHEILCKPALDLPTRQP